MDDCIYREVALKAVDQRIEQLRHHEAFNRKTPGMITDLYGIKPFIEALPSADVKPVIHGRWVKNEELSLNHVEPIFLCSNCNNFEAWGLTECYPYCPNCGADMSDNNYNKIRE